MRTVWHIAGMGNYRDVVEEQADLLVDSGIYRVDVTHVGEGLDWITGQLRRRGILANLVRSDPNLQHYETFAMLHIEATALVDPLPVLYFHTKGVSEPQDLGRVYWRRCMEEFVVRRWRQNLGYLATHDAVGCNYLDSTDYRGHHFSGNFWIATAAWLRGLPDFAGYHRSGGFERYSCETWIGSTPGGRMHSLIARNVYPLDWTKWINLRTTYPVRNQ